MDIEDIYREGDMCKDRIPDMQYSSVAIVGDKNLQTQLLAEIVSSNFHCSTTIVELNVDAETIGSMFVAEPMESVFLLFDCSVCSLDANSNCLDRMFKLFPAASGALLNVTSGTYLGSLVKHQWIKGLFYSDTSKNSFINGMGNLLEEKMWFPRDITDNLIEKLRGSPLNMEHLASLTKREKQILKLLVDCSSNKKIANELNVSVHTVKTHLYNIFKKIGARNRVEAVNFISTFRME